MGVVINPRGTSGAGKTEFARRRMADYGWPGGDAGAVHRRGRERPIGNLLRNPVGGRPLAVLGHYGPTGGCGCDTITAKDGGLPEAFRLRRHGRPPAATCSSKARP